MPEKYRGASKGKFTLTQLAEIEGFLMGWCEGVFLHGTQGTGKTFMATAMLQAWALSGKTGARWTTSPGMLAEIRSTYHPQAKHQEMEVIEKYALAPLLLIDDIGAEKITDWSVPAQYQIISDRVNWNRKTIITSNLSLDEIAEWNPRIASRLSGFRVIEMTGEDRRMAK